MLSNSQYGGNFSSYLLQAGAVCLGLVDGVRRWIGLRLIGDHGLHDMPHGVLIETGNFPIV
jgi:hypothetical protein